MLTNLREGQEVTREMRLHGRGGQGVVMLAEVLAVAFLAAGKYAAALPAFGAERRGSPVSSFIRFADDPIREKTRVYSPDCVIVLDPVQLSWPTSYAGLRPNGILVLNSSRMLEVTPHENVKRSGVIDATQIALEEIGRAVPNSCMLGSFCATTEWVSLVHIFSALEHYFEGEALKKNVRSAERGYEEVKVNEW